VLSANSYPILIQPALHAQPYFDQIQSHPEIFKYFPFGPFDVLQDFLLHLKSAVRRNPANVPFAAYAKPTTAGKQSWKIAGVVGLFYASRHNLSAEITYGILLPEYQRTFASTHVVCLLLRFCLEELGIVNWPRTRPRSAM